MILLDTNIVIYLHGGQLDDATTETLRKSTLDTCNIIVAEVLGFKGFDASDAAYFEQLFASMRNHLFDERITKKVIELRTFHAIRLPDAIIAATALEHDLELWTHNVDDFKMVPHLRIFDPIAKV